MKKNKNILLTGSTGFVGSAVRSSLDRKSYNVISVSQRGCNGTIARPIQDTYDWLDMLDGIDCIIHTAARVHVMKESALDPLALYRKLNVDATVRLAQQAAEVGVKRFVFLSSVKVSGERSDPNGSSLSESDKPFPRDAYSISKYEAEQGLFDIAKQSGLEVVVIRPPLVYGPGVKANFRALMKLVTYGVPLPISAVANRRSLVGINNLVSFILECVENPAAANETFLVSDGNDLSSPQLIQLMASALNKPARLVSAPLWLLRGVGSIVGKRNVVDRLIESLQVDISKAHDLLGWVPPYLVEDQLALTVADFLKTNPRFVTGLKKSNV